MQTINNNLKCILLAALILLTPVILLSQGSMTGMADIIKYELGEKSSLNITLTTVNPGIRALSADPSNKLVIKVKITDTAGMPVPGARIESAITNSMGKLYPSSIRTGIDGSCLMTYTPPYLTTEAFKTGTNKVNISLYISGTKTNASLSMDLIRIPVIFVHGYKTSPAIFDNFKDYLESRGFQTRSLNYTSESGVASGAIELGSYLDKTKEEYLKDGIQTGGFDIIAHSMGGLVARYYTSSKAYIMKNDIDKMIFISVPHTGSLLASLGLKYYNDQGICDLIPDGSLFTGIFPSMINRGLNRSIQVGNILGQYDEVVSSESASLEGWNIKTELFNVGDNNFTVDNLLNGKIIEASNHKVVLYNKKVFQRVEEMLDSVLPYPSTK